MVESVTVLRTITNTVLGYQELYDIIHCELPESQSLIQFGPHFCTLLGIFAFQVSVEAVAEELGVSLNAKGAGVDMVEETLTEQYHRLP